MLACGDAPGSMGRFNNLSWLNGLPLRSLRCEFVRFQSPLFPPVKHKVFISYHHGGDQPYYDAFTRTFHDTYELVYDNSLERRIDSDDVDYVRRRIRENHIKGSSCTIVLVGAQTWA